LVRTALESPALLARVSRPNRYVGNALHAPRKSLDEVDVKVCLALADAYEIGMSHLGLRILHHILNGRPDTAAEFCFAPWPDAEAEMLASGQRLFSLESQRPLKDFDLIGISLQYELHYTNVLNMLHLGGVPLHADQRGEADPLVLGGGHAAFNPEPMSDFFDAFVVGDGEELTGLVVDEVKAWRKGFGDRAALLRRLAKLEGVYVPSGYDLVPNASGFLCPRARSGWPEIVRSVWVESLKPEHYPDKPMVSLSEITHDRLAVEVMRGCTRGCRFCQAGMINRPVRQKAPDQIVSEVLEGIKQTGYDEVSLLSLSTTDHTEIVEAVAKITSNLCGSTPVALSLPSTRPGTLPESLAKTMTEGKRPHITLAPEAGSQRMRDVINKGVCEEELLESIEIAARQGYSGAKLYFMIGLPGERPEDLVGIVELAKKALVVGKKHAHGRFTVTVSISPHVPKVQTPFQWEAQDESRLVEEKVRLLRQTVKGSAVVLKWRDSETAFLEGVFSRGDRRLGASVEEAWRRGCRFDGWTEHLKYETWMGVFDDLKVDAASYLAARDPEESQPWEHIESPVTRKFLWKERQKAYAAQVTVDCRLAFCHACGIDDCPDRLSPTGRRPGAPEKIVPLPAPVALYGRRPRKTPLAASLALGTRFRLRYTKGADLRFISHLELLRAWERTLRRSGLPLAMTQGFHPHLKLAFGPPLPVGYTSIAEYLDLEFAKPPAADLEDVLNALLPTGLQVTGWRPILFKTTSLMAAVGHATCRVRFTDAFLASGEVSPMAFEDLLLEGISDLLGATTLVVRRQGGEGVKEFDARPSLESLVPLSGARALDVGIRFTPRAQGRPDELVRLMFPQADPRLLEMERTGLYRVQGEERLSPFDLLLSAVGAQEANRATG
jgi:radical SAM family uncharacterized protein/radical SAM-linked protein